jgi:RNA polymerase sigma-70 factor (ECF subfamily)
MDHVGQDSAAVSAVRDGDVERYRELVERHERRVFAVAWSRLGDAALAEEATQEAFIRGYRRLWLLGDGAKFAGWITSIARHAAINLGLRHRRELNKRERWSLEQAAAPETSVGDSGAPCTPEMLRQTLEELPAAHRECLVLFYLEGKSGAEAATALGISEAAFRVRLHRARGLLREQLEAKLETSLRELRPAKSLVPSVMVGVLGSSSAKAATAGATALGALAKFAPFTFVLSFLPFLFMLPGFLVAWLAAREDASNYRDQEGFRARLFQVDMKLAMFWLPVIMVAMFVVIGLFSLQVRPHLFYGFLALLTLFTTTNSGRSLAINRNRYAVTNFIGGAWLTAGLLAIWLGWLPGFWLMALVMVQALATVFASRHKPMRLDYSLFVRTAEGMLKVPEEDNPEMHIAPTLTRRELFAFARFLGNRWLVNNFRQQPEGLVLRLTPVKSSGWDLAQSLAFGRWSGGSTLVLRPDGTVTVRLHANDRKTLTWLRRRDLPSDAELESQVCAAVETAWRQFRAGQVHQAEKTVGETPNTEIFVRPAGRTKFRRVLEIIVLALAVVAGISLAIEGLSKGLKPVSVTEAQVRTFLANITTNRHPIIHGTQRTYPGDPLIALSFCLVLPPTNLFTRDALRAVHQEVFRAGGFHPQSEASSRLSGFQGSWLLHKAMEGGWIDWSAIGLNPQDATVYFHHLTTNQWQFRLGPEQSWSWTHSESFNVERLSNFTLNQLRWLRDVNCLDLVDRDQLIRQIAAVQVLSSTSAPGQPPIHDWRDVRGLFFTPCWPALLDTYYSLAALELLGGLDKIDHEQCIRGILRLHQGKGYFTSPDSGGYNEYNIEGDARDTFAAFESLRILRALNRVKDLERWQFRPQRRSVAKGQLAWDDVEAWVCQQRLERFLRERKENPQAPSRSLSLAWIPTEGSGR